jgi:hypothetical protein
MPLVPMQSEPVVEEDEAPKARKRLFRRGSDAPEAAEPVVPAVAPDVPQQAAAPALESVKATVDRTVVFAGAVAGFVGGAVSGAVVTTLLS